MDDGLWRLGVFTGMIYDPGYRMPITECCVIISNNPKIPVLSTDQGVIKIFNREHPKCKTCNGCLKKQNSKY